jgi:hypothetical protein
MPLGAMRHGFTYVAAGEAIPDDLWSATSSISANYQDYQPMKVDYVGDDSSGRPVFLYGYINTATTYPAANLFRRESNGDLTFATPIQIHNGGQYTQAVSGLDTNGDLVGFSSFTVGSGAYCKSYTININNLTLGTPGSFRDIYGSGLSAGFSYATYFGNGRFGAGGRISGLSQRMVSVTGSSVGSIIATVTLPFGDGVWQHSEGFDYQNDSYYRFVGSNGNQGLVGAGHYYGTSAGSTVSADLSTLGLSMRYTALLNSTNNAVMLTNSGSTIELAPYSVTWPTGGSTSAPSITAGTNLTLSEAGTNANVMGGINNSVIVVYRNNSGVWKRVTVTASGTSLSEGTPVALSGTPVGYYGTPWGKYVSTAQGNLLMFLVDGGNSTTNTTLYSEII